MDLKSKGLKMFANVAKKAAYNNVPPEFFEWPPPSCWGWTYEPEKPACLKELEENK